MASDVRIRFKSFLPGAGFNSSGAAKQGKTRVVGTVTVTAYGGSEGEPLSAVDVGLTSIDQISLRVEDEVGAAHSGSVTSRGVAYAKTTGHFYLFTDDDTGAAFRRTPVAVDAVQTLEFVAEGDGANDVELT